MGRSCPALLGGREASGKLKAAILISSCPRYLPLARWTAERIDQLWDAHPPIFFSGIDPVECPADLKVRSDTRNWMAVTRDAVSDLQSLGFSHAYLILDDHPPLEKCHAIFLNRHLPEAAARLGAACVGLLGYGQHRAIEGKILGERDLYLEQTSSSYRWRYSLHPGLWALEALDELICLRMSQYPAGGQTPWNFERHRDVGGVAAGVNGETFRVSGARWDAAQGRVCRQVMQWVRHAVFDLALFGVRLGRGGKVREEMSAKWLGAYSYYRGPYPIFWSGMMMQGKPNPHLGFFLQQPGVAGIRKSLTSMPKGF